MKALAYISLAVLAVLLGYTVSMKTVEASPWDIRSAMVTSSSLPMTDTEDVTFSPDGSAVYTIGGNNDRVFQRNLSIPWNISYASAQTQSSSTAFVDTSPVGLTWKPDGTKLYIIANSNDRIYQYTATTSFDVTTLNYDGVSTSTATMGETTPQSVQFSTSGTMMFIVGQARDRVLQYNLSTPWDISTAASSSNSIAAGQNPGGFVFRSDGRRYWISMGTNRVVTEYNLSTPWAITTAVAGNVISLPTSETPSLNSIYINQSSGENLFTLMTTLGVGSLAMPPEPILSTNASFNGTGVMGW